MSSASASRTPPTAHGNWKNDLPNTLTPAQKTYHRFNELIAKFFNDPQAVPDKNELNSLVCECMFHGEVRVLSKILAQEHLQTLHITCDDDQRKQGLSIGLQTLLKAMPDRWPVGGLTLSNQQLDDDKSALLFEVLNRMPDLESLHLRSCIVESSSTFGLLQCPRLPKLQSLHLEYTHHPFALLEKILAASQLSEPYLHSNHGFTIEQHHGLALAPQRQAGLRELTLGQLQAGMDIGTVVLFLCPRIPGAPDNARTLGCFRKPAELERLRRALKALQDKTRLTSLSLAGCWPYNDDTFNGTELAQLVSLKNLVSPDLSLNQFPESTAPVLMSLAAHPRLQRLDLHHAAMVDQLVDVLAIVPAHNTTLTSLQLPVMTDDLQTMQTNQSLRSLSIGYIERQCAMMTAEDRQQTYPNNLALMDRVAFNREQWEKHNDKN